MTPLELRPLKLSELLDRAFTLFKGHFTLFVGIMALPAALGLLAAVPMQIFSAQHPPPQGEAVTMEQMQQWSGQFAIMMGGMVALMIVYWLVYMVALGATTVAVADLHAGRTPTIGGAFARVRGRLGRLALLWLFAMLRLGGAFFLSLLAAILLIIALAVGVSASIGAGGPAVFGVLAVFAVFGCMLLVGFLSLRYAVCVPVVMLEEQTAGGSIRRSRELTRGFLLRVFVLFLFAGALTYTSLALFQGPFVVGAAFAGVGTPMAFWLQMAGLVFGSLGSMLTAPVLVIGFAVLYYDLRVRKEALDLQMMIGALDTPAGEPPPLGARPASNLPG